MKPAACISAAVAAVALVAASTASAASPSPLPPPPPTLTGEDLLAADFNGHSPSVTASCSANGSTITFSASGPATGPFTGTFTETGTATIGPATGTRGIFPAGTVTSLDASFTINSTAPAATVTGVKHLVLPAVPAGGICSEGFGGYAQAYLVEETTSYDARIQTSGGAYRDSGVATTQVGLVTGNFDILEEFHFTSFPTSADQCKDGGWQQYRVFKNQGDCVSFVTTSGGNPPSGMFAGVVAAAHKGHHKKWSTAKCAKQEAQWNKAHKHPSEKQAAAEQKLLKKHGCPVTV